MPVRQTEGASWKAVLIEDIISHISSITSSRRKVSLLTCLLSSQHVRPAESEQSRLSEAIRYERVAGPKKSEFGVQVRVKGLTRAVF